MFSAFFILFFCVAANAAFAKFFNAPSNTESAYITALILALIITPAQSLNQILFLFFLSGLAMASKYVLAIRKKHIFNPAAFAIAFMSLTAGYSASWWIGNAYTMPLVLATGILIARKIKMRGLVVSFIVASSASIIGHSFFAGGDILKTSEYVFFHSFIFFMGFIMVTEPMTTPPDKKLRIAYGAVAGLLTAPFINIAGLYFAPETALIIGNIFSYAASPKIKLILRLKERIRIARDTFDFVFLPDRKIEFKPGQYLEWTLAHAKQDNRGMRRYFTIASSPTENEIRVGVKFYEKPSSYKKFMRSMKAGSSIVASQLAGDFIMPREKNKKLVFIAGGIGVTPIRSMLKYLTDTGEKRDIVVFYSNKDSDDIAYREIFQEADDKLGIKTIFSLTNTNSIPADWSYERGQVNEQMIKKYAPDYKKRIFFISGPRTMVVSFQQTLKKAGVRKNHIKTDFFPGYA